MDRRFSRGKKQALNFRGQLQVTEKAITLLLNGLDKRFLPLDITLNHINNEAETEQR